MVDNMEQSVEGVVEKVTSEITENTNPAPQEATGIELENAAVDPAASVQYQPNYKFKVMDQEREFDEFIRGTIKDAETEKKARELYEKAYGLDVIKPKFHETREKYKKLDQEHQGVMSQVAELRDLYSRGDLDGFFQKLNVPKDKILQWVVDQAKYEQLPSDQRQILDARKQAEQKALELERSNQSLEQRYQEQVTEAKRYALEATMKLPDVQSYAESFDARAGKPGAFWEAVTEHGHMAYVVRKVDLTPEQAIREVMTRYGQVAPAASHPQNDQVPSSAAQVSPVKEPPVIPNVSGRSTSPMKPKANSIADLRKIAASFN